MGNLKEQILAATKKLERVAIGDLAGVQVYLRRMTSAEAEIFDTVQNDGNLHGFMRTAVSLCLCDSDGKRIFEPDELKEINFESLNTLFGEVIKLNGLNKEAHDDIKKKPAETSGSSLPTN